MRKIVHWFNANDQRAALYIFHKWRRRKMAKLFSQITHMGDSWFTISVMVLLMLLTRFDWRGLLALTISHCIVQVFKRHIPRKRPYDRNEQIELYGNPLQDFSFPSGHTSAAFTIATALSFTVPIFAPVFLSLAVLVGFSRVYLGFHYPSDVVIGALIGSGSAIAIFMI